MTPANEYAGVNMVLRNAGYKPVDTYINQDNTCMIETWNLRQKAPDHEGLCQVLVMTSYEKGELMAVGIGEGMNSSLPAKQSAYDRVCRLIERQNAFLASERCRRDR